MRLFNYTVTAPTVQDMAVHAELLNLEVDEAQQLLTLYTDTDRRVLDKQAEIEAEARQLAEARARDRVPDNEVTTLNERRRTLEGQHLAATLAAQENAIRAAGSRKIAAEMRERVRELGVADVQKDALVREVQASSDAYLLYRKKAEEARLAAGLDDKVVGNVAIGELASAQVAPVGPPKNLSLVFAIAVGMVSGVGAAFLRELFQNPA